ncbi:MAG TPA: hypothetical protein VNM92_03290 [Thermoanaerobaculia bacterium]|nr:hypothetical protein [Thermoanaerobaculia bacterium]
MEELRVPTLTLPVSISYFDEKKLKGEVFLPAMAATHEGPTRPEEWLNYGNPFFPFVPEGQSRAVILNKRYVIVLTVALDSFSAVGLTGVERRVSLECGSLSLSGAVLIDMPASQSRLADWINRPDRFLLLKGDSEVHLVQKSRITRLSEIREEQRVN